SDPRANAWRPICRLTRACAPSKRFTSSCSRSGRARTPPVWPRRAHERIPQDRGARPRDGRCPAESAVVCDPFGDRGQEPRAGRLHAALVACSWSDWPIPAARIPCARARRWLCAVSGCRIRCPFLTGWIRNRGSCVPRPAMSPRPCASRGRRASRRRRARSERAAYARYGPVRRLGHVPRSARRAAYGSDWRRQLDRQQRGGDGRRRKAHDRRRRCGRNPPAARPCHCGWRARASCTRDTESDSGAGMTVLFLTHRVPYAPNRGDRLRALHIARSLAASTDLELVSLAHDRRELEQAATLEALGIRVTAIQVPRLANLVNGALRLAGNRPLTHVL